MASFTFGYGGAYGYRGSLALAQILYQTQLGDFTYNTDASGNIVLTNQGSDGTSYDALPYSSRFIELGALNDVEFPIHHTLGADNKKLASSVDTGWTDNLDNTYTGSTVTGDIVGLTILTSGTFKVTITLSSVTAGDVNGYTADGTYVFEETLTASLNLTGTGFTGVVTVVSAEQITNPNSYITYYDFTDGLVTLGNSVDGGGSKEYVTDGEFNTGDFTYWFNLGLSTSYDGDMYSIVNNALVSDGNGPSGKTDIYSDKLLTTGKTYRIRLDASNKVGTGTYIQVGGVELGSITVGVGVEYTIIATATTPLRFRTFSGTNSLTIDNVSVKEILPISTKYTLNTKTVNNIITHTTPWSLGDWAKINNNPNLIGKLALETLGATKTIPELDMVMDAGASADSYYMCSENSGAYLVDSRVDYGSTIVTNGTFDTDTDWTKGTGWTIALGVASSDGTQVADSLLTTSTIPVTVASSTYLVSFEVTSYTAGNVALQFDGIEIITDKAATGTYYAIATASDTTGTIDIVADLNFIGSVDNVTAQLISAIPIASYAETVRTNADLQQKGIQTTAFVTDGVGVPTSYSDNLLNFYGYGRINSQWVADITKDFIIEIGIYTDNDGVTFDFGGASSGTNQIKFRKFSDGRVFATLGDTLISTLPGTNIGGMSLCQLKFNSSTTTADWYINGVTIASSVSIVTFTAPTIPFNLFGLDGLAINTSGTRGIIDHFKIITDSGQISNYDALTEYNKYLA